MEPLKKISEVGREVGLSDRRIREYERAGWFDRAASREHGIGCTAPKKWHNFG